MMREIRRKGSVKSTHNELLLWSGDRSGCFSGAGRWRAFFAWDCAGGLAFGVRGAGLSRGAAGGGLVFFDIAGELAGAAVFLGSD